MSKPLVSVIMPAYNAELYIEESVASILNQSYRNLELIIVNDCSNDNTLQILEKFSSNDERIIVLNNDTNLGCAQSRNKALQITKGEYIAFCDSDDVWMENKIEKQLSHIKNSNADMVFTAYEMIDSSGQHIKYRNIKEKVLFDDLLRENFVIFSTTIFRRGVIEEIQFNDRWYHEDYVFLLDCMEHQYEFGGLNENLVKYRISKNGRSYNKFCSAKHRWIILRKYLKIDLVLSIWYFIQYIFYGVKKYK